MIGSRDGATTSLRPAATSGVRWSAASQVGRQALVFASSIVLLRILGPADIGHVNMAIAAVNFVDLFRDLGTAAAIIQRQHLQPRLVASLYWINAAIGVVAAAALVVAAPVVAAWNRDGSVAPLVTALALAPAITGFGNVPRALMERRLEFAVLARVELVAVAGGAACGIAAALSGAGVWSLVAQTLVTKVLDTALVMLASGFRPTSRFALADVREVAGFSLNLGASSCASYIVRNADNLLIGRFLGPEALGWYLTAYNVVLVPLRNVAWVIGRVAYPAMASVQGDLARLRRVWIRAAGAVAAVATPMVLGAMAVSPELILATYGAAWAPSAPLIRLLGPTALFQAMTTMAGLLFQTMGRTDRLLQLMAGTALVYVTAFAVGLHWGVVGVAVGTTVAALLTSIPMLVVPFALVGLRLRDLLREVARPFLASLVMLASVLVVRALIPGDWMAGVRLTVAVVAGVAVHAAASWTLDRRHVKELLALTPWAR